MVDFRSANSKYLSSSLEHPPPHLFMFVLELLDVSADFVSAAGVALEHRLQPASWACKRTYSWAIISIACASCPSRAIGEPRAAQHNQIVRAE